MSTAVSADRRHHFVGIDVGGTFTDVFAVDVLNGTCAVHKVASTRGKEAEGFLQGILTAVTEMDRIAAVVHGTTVGTNALLERQGARTGLITTQGFRDILEMRRRDRPTTWGLRGRYRPVVDRLMSVEVTERILADGSVHVPLDEQSVRDAAAYLQAQGAESVAVAFVNSYANPCHEQRVREILSEIWTNDHISISSQLLPEIREFERASTTALNAYLQPVVGPYLTALDHQLTHNKLAGEFLIVQSNGGLTGSADAAKMPVRTALSGPAAGVFAAAFLADGAGYENVITCDMGGTSFDVSVVAEGEPALAAQSAIDFGLVIRSPMIEISTIGAGGGSIASIDEGGMLQIGPESAGSDPGPVCYGQGNDRPTVTDANVVLGRINADRPIGGRLARLGRDAAEQAIGRQIGAPLGMNAMRAAEAIIDVANARMAGAIRLVSVERGHDPRHFAVMPFGGGGALHACALAREIGFACALVPRFPGVVSALGCAIGDMRRDFVRTVNRPLAALDMDSLRQTAENLAADGRQWLISTGLDTNHIRSGLTLDMLYSGQTHAIDLSLDLARMSTITRQAIGVAFARRYAATYGQSLDQVDPVVVNLRVSVIGKRPKFDLSLLAPPADATVAGARRPRREVWFDGAMVEAQVFDRLRLPVGALIEGPAVFEQADATTWLEPGFIAEVDGHGNLVVKQRGGE